MTKGILGNMFDLNRDGKMNVFERAAEFAFIEDVLEIEDNEVNSSVNLAALEEEDLDFDDLALMDDWERREVLEEAGLDPDDYDFD